VAKKRIQKIPRVKRGEIYFANLNPVVGSEQGGVRPVLILQNDTGNKYSPTTIVAAVTSRHKRARLPTHVPLAAREGPLDKDSVVLLEQVRTIDKTRLKEKIGKLSPEELAQVQDALKLSLGFNTQEEELDLSNNNQVNAIKNSANEKLQLKEENF